MIQIRTDQPQQTFDDDVAKDINREIERCEHWVTTKKGGQPLTSYEKGAIRMYLIFKLQEATHHVGVEGTV